MAENVRETRFIVVKPGKEETLATFKNVYDAHQERCRLEGLMNTVLDVRSLHIGPASEEPDVKET